MTKAVRAVLFAAVAVAPLMLATTALSQESPATPPSSTPALVRSPEQTATNSADASGNAAPEDTSTDVSEVVVTGTSIRGVAPAGSPVIGLSEQQIRATGATNTSEVLRQLPQIFNLGADDAHFNAANNANANVTQGTGINLRGLGTEATLTVLEGRRVPPAGTQGQFFDPSVIPTGAIGRIEVMADGGSAIYGADAVGGVVNILLRRNFDGVEAFTRYGVGDDIDQQVWGATFGRRWADGSFMVSAELNYRTSLPAASRSYFTDNLAPFGGTDQRSFNSSPGNILVGTTRYAIPRNQNGVGLTAARFTANTANLQSAYEGVEALPEQNRRSIAFTFDQQLNENFRFSLQGFYAGRQSQRATTALSANLTVPRSNPFFVNPANPAATTVTVNYSFIDDFGNNYRRADQRVGFITGGLDVNLGADWRLSMYASAGRDEERSSSTGVNNTQLSAALADTNPATAFNPFGDGSFTNRTTLDRILGYSDINSNFDLFDMGAKVDGPVWTLPAGEVRAALGVEYQDNTLVSFGGGTTGTANNTIFAPRRTQVQRDVASIYAEVFVPLVSDANAMTGVQELSLSIAGRFDSYSDFGSTSNPKIGLVWRPIDELRVRGSYSTSFRAPTLADIDVRGSLTIAIQDFTDPTASTGRTRTLWVRGGNENLQPEEATIYSIGADYTPSWAPGLSLSFNYFDVEYTNRIETPGNDTLALTREAQLSGFIIRNPSAALVNQFQNDPVFTGVRENPANILAFVDGRKFNIGSLHTSGLEFIGRYQFDSDYGLWTVGLNAQRLFAFERSLTPSSPTLDVLDTLNNPLDFQARGELGWRWEGFGATAFVNYYDGYRNDTVTPNQMVDSFTTVDLSFRYNWTDGPRWMNDVTFSVDVQNAFDEQPPVVYNANLAFDPQVASPIGRFVLFGIRSRW